MPVIRLRLRILMILVAVVALAHGGWIAKRRYDAIRKHHEFWYHEHEYVAGWARAAASNLERSETSDRMAPHDWYVQEISRMRRYEAYHRVLSLKYRAGADRPWMPVSANPKLPDDLREIVGPTSW